MSYAVTDAVEDDMKNELKVVETLNEQIDELAGVACGCSDLAPEVKDLLDLAWFFTEKAIRETRGCCSAGCSDWPDHKRNARDENGRVLASFCACCHHYDELQAKARRIKAVL